MSIPSYVAIPTWYKGQQYRSKLEACWAAFFELLDLRFEYELDAFALPSGNYTPDFFLPDVCEKLGQWVEIKATAPTDHERRHCRELCEATGREVVLVWGQPMTHVDAIAGDWKTACCSAWAWCDDQPIGSDFPTPVTWWAPNLRPHVYRHAAIEAHRAVRWDPVTAATARADVAWRARRHD